MKKLKFFLGFTLGLMFCIIPNVYADLPTGEIWSESATNKYEMAKILTCATSSNLYGLNGNGSEFSPTLSTFYSGTNSLFTYGGFNNTTRCNWAMQFNLSNSLVKAHNYTATIYYTKNPYISWDFDFYLSSFGDDAIDKGELNYFNNSCAGDNCSLLLNFTMTDTTTRFYINVPKVEQGMSLYFINEGLDALYFPQFIDNGIINNTEVLEQQNTTIINQNQQIINRNDTIINQNQQTNDKLDNLNQNITNNNVSGVEGAFESFEGFISENSTITQLIIMPITLYTSILNGVQSTCQPFSLGSLFGTNLFIPCVNIGNYLGSTLWSMIDIIISGFAIFSISKKFIKIFNNFSTMKEGDVIND